MTETRERIVQVRVDALSLEGALALLMDLLTGGEDAHRATRFEKLGARKELVVVPRATHLFEEPGTLEEVARLARDWFARYPIPRAGERRSA